MRFQKPAQQSGWKQILGSVLLLAGIFIFVFPCCEQWITKAQEEKMIRSFQQENTGDFDEKISEGRTDENAGEKSIWKEPGLQNKIIVYNKELFSNNQNEFSDEHSVEKVPLFLEKYQDYMFGYIEIPKIACRMPMYLGASEEHMDQGVAVLGGTSLPVGGVNSNCVIAGHRGWKRREYLKRIEELSIGDEVFVTNPWECLSYRVTDTEIICPNESEKLKIQKGQDMITLLTCHPYRSGGKYRYLVYCTRTETEQNICTETENAGTMEKEKQQVSQRERGWMEEKKETTSVPDIRREKVLRKTGGWIVIILLCLTILMKLKKQDF